MEPFFVIAFGVMVTAAVYLLLSRNVLRIILGLLLFSNGVNLSIFIAGRIGRMQPPIVAPGQVTLADGANPLPQAMILTAIVISFALTVFAVTLFERAHRCQGTLDTDDIQPSDTHYEMVDGVEKR